MITHIVLFWTDKPGTAEQKRLMEGAELLKDIPGVANYRFGTPVPSPRGVVDDSYSVALAMDFADAEAAANYQAHPLHVRFVEEFVKPNVRRFVVYDFG